MSGGNLLRIQPHELKFRVEAKKQSSCSLRLTNRSDQNVAFKVKTTNPKKYSVRPNAGVVSPGASFDVTVTMQAQKDVPADMQSKDKFLIQCVAGPPGMTSKEVTSEMFSKEAGNVVEEFKLRVTYVLTNFPSPVTEGSEEGVSPRVSGLENGSNSAYESKDKGLETWTTITRLTNEKNLVAQQNQKLRQELDLIRKSIGGTSGGSFSLMFVILVGLLGIFAGYLIKNT